MASAETALATDVVRTAADAGLTANGTALLWCSADQNNSTGQKSLRLVVRYDNVSPDFGSVPLTFELVAVVETKIGSKWSKSAYQFQPYRNSLGAEEHIIMLQPDAVVIDQGIPDVIYYGDEEQALIHRQQGKLGDVWRACVYVTERGYGGPGAFASVKLTALAETFDV